MTPLNDYTALLEAGGIKTIPGGKDHFWMVYEKKAAARSPAFVLDKVNKEEIKEIFQKLNPVFITYNIRADEEGKGNAFLYVSTDREYDIEKLDKNGRRFARTGHKNFQFRFAEWDTILSSGFKAFSDTRERNGLSDGTKKNFERIFTACKKTPAFKAIAAFKPGDDNVYAFLQITEVENWVEITSSYSRDDYLRECPNNGLFDTAFNYYLKEKRAALISYGISSVQKASKKDSLHEFKLRIGFEAVPIKRIFLVNPKYRPLINKYSHFIIKALLKMFPHERRINKLEGVLSLLNEDE